MGLTFVCEVGAQMLNLCVPFNPHQTCCSIHFLYRRQWGTRSTHHWLWKVLWMPGERWQHTQHALHASPHIRSVLLSRKGNSTEFIHIFHIFWLISIQYSCPTLWVLQTFFLQRCSCQDPVFAALPLVNRADQRWGVPPPTHSLHLHPGHLWIWGTSVYPSFHRMMMEHVITCPSCWNNHSFRHIDETQGSLRNDLLRILMYSCVLSFMCVGTPGSGLQQLRTALH